MKPAAKHLLDIIYPPHCISCGDIVSENGNICPDCWGDINFITDPQCEICGFPFDFEVMAGSICAGCAKKPPSFSRARAVFLYDDASSSMVTSFKYSDRVENRAAYARWMARVGRDIITEVDFIIPVPLHFFKLLTRKYNQAALLSHEIARIADKEVLARAIIRKKYTKTQAAFSHKGRFKNIGGAFKINPKYQQILYGKKILLVDDVVTTGATADECAKVLRKAGVERVELLTLAKTLY
jgi:ComF family protein